MTFGLPANTTLKINDYSIQYNEKNSDLVRMPVHGILVRCT